MREGKIFGRGYYKGEVVNIYGGFEHPEKGHFVVIGPTQRSSSKNRLSVSLWDVSFPNLKHADEISCNCFQGRTLEKAKKIDQAKGLIISVGYQRVVAAA